MEKLNKIFRTAQIAALDNYTIEHEPIQSLDLMERAANIWTKHFLACMGECPEVIVLAGTGNNGGDGYAIARLLMSSGKPVTVWRLAGENKLSPDCEMNYKRWLEMGGTVLELTGPEDVELLAGHVLIDALFGSGLNRPVTGLAAEIIKRINASPAKVVAVDMPSGLMGEDNGNNDPDAIIRADYTFTFQFPKVAFMLPENFCYVGYWKVLDIGLNREIIEKTPTLWYYTTSENVSEMLPVPEKYAHKGTNGTGLLIAGHAGMMGAAVLAAKAALRSGVGLLYCHIPGKSGDILQIAVPEAILDFDESKVRFSGVGNLSRYNAIAIGPGLGRGPETVGGLRALLHAWRGITILDADALNLMAEHKELLELLHEKCILTPHMKEFERLAGKSRNDFDRLNKLSTFASQYKTYVVLKGANSVIAARGGQLYFNTSGNPGMAKGGAGDVLTGVLLALAANGMEVTDVVRAGVFAHGLSGDLLAEEFGFRGIASGMIAENMGKAWKQLETEKMNNGIRK